MPVAKLGLRPLCSTRKTGFRPSRYGPGMPDARLTTPAFLVLGIIDKLGEASPYDVKIEAAGTVAPFWSMPHAQVYAQCDRLVETGLLSEVRQTGGRNRRLMR